MQKLRNSIQQKKLLNGLLSSVESLFVSPVSLSDSCSNKAEIFEKKYTILKKAKPELFENINENTYHIAEEFYIYYCRIRKYHLLSLLLKLAQIPSQEPYY